MLILKMAESGDDLQKQKNVIVIKTPLKSRPKKHVFKNFKDGLQREYTSRKLSPKVKFGIEEPSNSDENGASKTDLSMEHEDLKPYQDINNGFELFQTQESDWDSCSSSLVEDCDRFCGEIADAPNESELMSEISPLWESSPNAEPRTWIEIGRLPPTIRRLLVTKYTINEKMRRFEETGNFDNLPTSRNMDEFSKMMNSIFTGSGQLLDKAEKLMNSAKNLKNNAKKFKDTNISKEMMENSEKLMKKADKIIKYVMKLMEIVQKMTDIKRKWKDILSDWIEDHDNAGSFPGFIANFLFVSALFAVLVVPALVVKYSPI